MAKNRVSESHLEQHSARIDRDLVYEDISRHASMNHPDTFDPALFDASWSRTRNLNRLELMVRTPTSLYAYWEVRNDWQSLIETHFQVDWTDLAISLRLHDVTDLLFDGSNAHHQLTVTPSHTTDHWYFEDIKPGRDYLADFGAWTMHGQFFSILRSNRVTTPRFECGEQLEVRFAGLGTKTNFSVQPPTSHPVNRRSPDEIEKNVLEGTDNEISTTIYAYSGVVPYAHQFDGYSATEPRNMRGAEGGE